MIVAGFVGIEDTRLHIATRRQEFMNRFSGFGSGLRQLLMDSAQLEKRCYTCLWYMCLGLVNCYLCAFVFRLLLVNCHCQRCYHIW